MNPQTFLDQGLTLLGRRLGYKFDLRPTKPSERRVAFPQWSEPIALTPGTSTHQMAAWLNPAGMNIVILDVILDVTTKSTGAATADVGIAADAVTSNDSLIDGVDIGTAAIFATAGRNGGTNGATGRI